MVLSFLGCDINTSLGVLRTADNRSLVIPTQKGQRNDVCSVQVQGAIASAVIKVRKTNTPALAGTDYASGATFDSTHAMTDLLAVASEYLSIELTVVNGAAAQVDIHVHFRPSDIGQVVTT